MALSPREFVEEVNKFFDIIEQRKNNVKSQKTGFLGRIKFGEIDVADIKNELIEITISLHRLFISQQSIDSLSNWDTAKVLKKAKAIALAGVCQIFKEYNNREEANFWQFYSNNAALSLNDEFYTKVLEPAIYEEKILPESYAGKYISFTNVIAKESELSPYCLEDVIYLFGVYRKYFYPNLKLSDYFKEINNKNEELSIINLIPRNTSEKINIQDSCKRLLNIEQKVNIVLQELNLFTNYVNNTHLDLNNETLESLIKDFYADYEIDVNYLFKTPELKEQFFALVPSVSLFKFRSILRKEEPSTKVKLPEGKSITVEELLALELCYGIYQIKDTNYDVSPNTALSSAYFAITDKDKFSIHGNKLILRSFESFTINLGVSESCIKALKLFKDGKFEGYLWYDNKPLLEVASVTNESIEIADFEPEENIVSALNLRLIESHVAPRFELDLEYLLLVSKENKGKKLELINTDQMSMPKEFPIDAVAYSGQISYPIHNRKSGIISLLLTSNKEKLELKNFEPRLNCELDDSILFDAKLKTQITPNQVLDYGNGKFYLFSTKNFESKWVNEVCEVVQYNDFGNYHVYQISWLDPSKKLDIKINNYHKWSFLNRIDYSFSAKEPKYNAKYIDYKSNQFLSFRDINYTIQNNENTLKVNQIQVKAWFNFSLVAFDINLGTINKLIERDVNSTIIDELFIKTLLNTFSSFSFGRYDIEFSLGNTIIQKLELFIIPELSATQDSEFYLEEYEKKDKDGSRLDEIIVTLSSKVPCFRNRKTTQKYLFDNIAKCNFYVSNNKQIEYKKEAHLKRARIFNPYTEINLKCEPEVAGYRFMQDGRIYSTSSLDYESLDKTSILIRSIQKDARLKVNSNVVKPLIPNNMGIILEHLKSIKGYLSKTENLVSIQMGRQELSFQVFWNAKVFNFFSNKPFYDKNEGISFSITYEGPSSTYIKFMVVNKEGKPLNVRSVSCGEESAPKFVRNDRNKNYIFIACDGKKWENRDFIIHLEPREIDVLETVYLKGFYDIKNELFGELVFRNQNTNNEVNYLNQVLNKENANAYALFERGVLYSELNLLTLANEDFDNALKEGLNDTEAIAFIELFKKDLPSSILNFEINQLTYLADKLCKDDYLLI